MPPISFPKMHDRMRVGAGLLKNEGAKGGRSPARLQPLDGGAAPQPVSTCGFPSLTRAIRKVRAQPHRAKAIKRYCPMVRTTLASGRVLFEDSLSWCVTISSYLGVVVSGCRDTMWTTL